MRAKAKKAVALGFFDGVHIGHQALLRNLLLQKEEIKCAYTFLNHPQSFFDSGRDQELLCSARERERLLKECGVHEVIMAPFDDEMAKMPAEDFALFVLEGLDAGSIVVGNNYRFGKGARGTPQMLADFARMRGARLIEAETVLYEGEPVSSTRIRNALKKGDIILANAMLGRSYSVEGIVGEGRKIGRTLNIPTANIPVPENRALPMDGVYKGIVELEGASWKAVVNIGKNPTVGGESRLIESHLLGFAGDIYGKEIKVSFQRRIRGEIMFSSKEELKDQILKDINSAL
ncbi:MAG: bifunctional riboflavin kinase/FAD synthetase [Christensenellales bacterium]|jgi:riboflavin kinase/FMN adenylyltransferase